MTEQNKPRSVVMYATPLCFTAGGLYRTMVHGRTATHPVRVRITEEPEPYRLIETPYGWAITNSRTDVQMLYRSMGLTREDAELLCVRLNNRTYHGPNADST